MGTQEQPNEGNQKEPKAQEPEKSSERSNKTKVNSDRYKWWQATILLVGTLIICLSAGYYVSAKYLWNNNNDQLTKQLKYYQAKVDQKPNDSQLRVQLGYTYYLKGDDQNAIKQLQTAKNLDSKNYNAYLNLGIVYDKENQNDKFLEVATKAVKLAPQDYKAQLMAGRAYRKLKMYKKASDALDKAIRLKPGNTDTIYEAGMVAEDQGQIKEAENIYKETLTFDPTYKPALQALERLKSKNK